MKTIFKPALLVLMFLLQSELMLAQADQDEDIDDVPVDAGIGLLVLCGGIYGYRNMRQSSRFQPIKSTQHESHGME
jgi:hypothetical protein